jgi:uncharacterized membrane protein YccF (DUF307 family)
MPPAAPQPPAAAPSSSAAPPPPLSRATAPTMVAETKDGPGLLVRALWFVFIGWWLTGIVSSIAWFAMITIIGLPLGIWLVNRIPTVLTLRPRTSYVYAWTDAAGNAQTSEVRIEQPAWWIRGLWFVIVGWWASALVMSLGFLLVVIIITMPIGLMLYNRVPFVASLYRY